MNAVACAGHAHVFRTISTYVKVFLVSQNLSIVFKNEMQMPSFDCEISHYAYVHACIHFILCYCVFKNKTGAITMECVAKYAFPNRFIPF